MNSKIISFKNEKFCITDNCNCIYPIRDMDYNKTKYSAKKCIYNSNYYYYDYDDKKKIKKLKTLHLIKKKKENNN